MPYSSNARCTRSMIAATSMAPLQQTEVGPLDPLRNSSNTPIRTTPHSKSYRPPTTQFILEYILGFWWNCELGKSLVKRKDLTSWPAIDSGYAITLRNLRGLGGDLAVVKPRFRIGGLQCPSAWRLGRSGAHLFTCRQNNALAPPRPTSRKRDVLREIDRRPVAPCTVDTRTPVGAPD